MALKETRRNRPWRSVALALALFVAIPLAVSAMRTYQDLIAAREKRAELERQAAETEAQIESLERKIERMRDDPLTLEWLGREHLGLIKPGEVVIEIPEEKSRPQLGPQVDSGS